MSPKIISPYQNIINNISIKPLTQNQQSAKPSQKLAYLFKNIFELQELSNNDFMIMNFKYNFIPIVESLTKSTHFKIFIKQKS